MPFEMSVRRAALRQFLRYVVVGMLNTLVTLVVIFLCKSLWGVNMWVSNALGYVAGLVNSFIWNKLWVFHSHGTHTQAMHEALHFGVGFLLCYGLQFVVTWLLTTPMELGELTWEIGRWTLSGYGLATLVGMVVYTFANFIYNRLVTFR